MITDADIETGRMIEIARGLANARRAGHCSHERRQGELRPDAKLINNHKPKYICLECGKKATWAELDEERREVLIEWT
tara:strand:- start:1209 stop:1442 length:234 start_codon:yes stop_codon:yes gene_type:complete